MEEDDGDDDDISENMEILIEMLLYGLRDKVFEWKNHLSIF